MEKTIVLWKNYGIMKKTIILYRKLSDFDLLGTELWDYEKKYHTIVD